MQNTISQERPTSCPWGGIQTTKKLGDGVYVVSTAGHGGFMVRPDLPLSDSARKRAIKHFTNAGRWLAYEEDQAWAIAAWELRDQWDSIFEFQRAMVSPGAHVCYECYEDEAFTYRRRGGDLPPLVQPAERPLVGSVDGFGYCGRHESHVKINRRMATDPEGYLRNHLSAWEADYLIERGDELDPEGYAYYLRDQERSRLRSERNPDYTIAAVRVAPGVTKVWTADDKIHYVTAESYGSSGEVADHRLSRMVLADYSEAT